MGHRRLRANALPPDVLLGCVMIITERGTEQYQIAAAEYEIISRLATTDFRRDMYELLASKYRQLAADHPCEGSRMTPTA